MADKSPVVDAVLGVGGAGGWLCQLRAKSEGNPMIIIDGDEVTESNLNRQFYSADDVGDPKVKGMQRFLAEARVPVTSFNEFLYVGSRSYKALLAQPAMLRLFVCVDNHPARRAALALADARQAEGRQTLIVIAANETTTASADVYRPSWRGSPLDFRVRYPEVETDEEGDPLHPPCTGEALRTQPQLAIANSLGALCAAWLADVWSKELPALAESPLYPEIEKRAPVSIQWTAGAQKTLSVQDITKEPSE